MSGAPDLPMIREEVATILAQVSAHAGAAAVHAQAGTDGLMAAELRCCAASLMAAAGLVEHLRPGRRAQEGCAA